MKFDLQEFFPYRLTTLSHEIAANFAKIYGTEFGISIAEWRVLVHLDHSEAISVREIHHAVRLDKMAVTRAVQRLSDRGLISKSANLADRRLLSLVLTQKGHALVLSVDPVARAFQRELMSELDSSEIQELDRLLQKLWQGLSKIQRDEN
jgi:DNA-binding MarR family transcriptional regulator